MKITMIMVASVNGKITAGDNPDVRKFSSKEDAALFEQMKKKFNLIIMGRKTYEAAKERIKLDPQILRVVFTRNPKAFTDIPGQLEFTDESPEALLERLDAYTNALLVGGQEINGLFLKKKLVDELHLTVEPWILGTGKHVVDNIDANIRLRLLSIKQLNAQGTMYCVYKIVN